MMIKKRICISMIGVIILCFLACISCSSDTRLKDAFIAPDNQYRPMPFWHINGELTTQGIEQQLTNARNLSGFGGVNVLPVNPHTQWGTGYLCPGTGPRYLSEAYFERYADILKVSKELGTEVILYDDIDFPSGTAGGRLKEEYPEYVQKLLVKDEIYVKGPQQIKYTRPDTTQLLMAVSAMDTITLQIIDLAPYLSGNTLNWEAPEGSWRILFFNCKFNAGNHVDFMQPEAIDKMITMTYDEYAKRFGSYFGNVITKTFYDDVGFVHQEETWTPAITDVFRQKYGKNPALYYPALFYDIGEETAAARVAFYDIRSEMMAEGYPKKVAEWSTRQNLMSMGHPPENYSPNSVVANGDILKYYRHTQIPLLDAIFFYGRGIHGFKQISSAADLGDKPVVGAEIYGAFPAHMDSLTLYRVAMEVMARGVNFIVPHGMWYDTHEDRIRIPPLISYENPLLGKSLPRYSTWVARSCMMLQGGANVADIALLWPITAVQAESYINRDKNSGLPVANWLPANVRHHELSDLLTNRLHRDFTFIHPEDLYNGKISAVNEELVLNNKKNIQRYKVLIIPGGDVISVQSLKAIKQYYDGGGKVIFVSSLPYKSAEFGQDRQVTDLIKEMTGGDAMTDHLEAEIFKENSAGGQLAFVASCTQAKLEEVMNRMKLAPDVMFDQIPKGETGYVNYIHKQKDNKNIYFVTNSTDKPVNTTLSLKGRQKPEMWDPYTGEVWKVSDCKMIEKNGTVYTQFVLSLPEVSSMFVVSNN